MTLDPDVQKWLQQAAAAGIPPIEQLGVEQARRMMRETSVPLGPGDEIARVEDRRIPGPAGEIPIRIYAPQAREPLPIVVFFHGGGWVVGDIETHDALCRCLANRACLMVVSVDYRLAPEHRYPAAAEDAYAATKWLSEHGSDVGGDGTRLAVMGDSAGGNLAAVVCLMARERQGPAIQLQVLLYPITDHNFDTDSYLRNLEGFHLTRNAMMWFWDQYAPEKSQRDQPFASPMRANDLSNLPPALMITAEYDPLLDEGEAYARRLEAAGNRVTVSRYPGTIHGFTRRMVLWEHARQSVDEIASALRSALLAPSTASTSIPTASQ